MPRRSSSSRWPTSRRMRPATPPEVSCARASSPCTATSSKPLRRMFRYEFEGKSSRSSPVSVTTTSQPSSAARRIRARRAACSGLPCHGAAASSRRSRDSRAPSATYRPAADAGSSPSRASQHSQPVVAGRARRPVRAPRGARSRRRRSRANAFAVLRALNLLEAELGPSLWQVADAAPKRHPTPARLEPACREPRRQLGRTRVGRDGHVERRCPRAPGSTASTSSSVAGASTPSPTARFSIGESGACGTRRTIAPPTSSTTGVTAR